MFGGLTFMVGGQMCCGVLKDELIVRIEAEEFDALTARPGVRAFDFSGRPMQGMVYVAQQELADQAALRDWVGRGLAYLAGHPAAPKRRKRG